MAGADTLTAVARRCEAELQRSFQPAGRGCGNSKCAVIEKRDLPVGMRHYIRPFERPYRRVSPGIEGHLIDDLYGATHIDQIEHIVKQHSVVQRAEFVVTAVVQDLLHKLL